MFVSWSIWPTPAITCTGRSWRQRNGTGEPRCKAISVENGPVRVLSQLLDRYGPVYAAIREG